MSSTPTPITGRQRRFVRVAYTDPLGQPLLQDLEREYDARYGDVHADPAITEILRYPPEDFAAPDGTFLLLLEDDVPVSGGAFKRLDAHTAELKRVWTASTHRGLGLAGQVLSELEREASQLGYTRIYLTTGPRQPEAVRLYLKNGYVPLFDQRKPAEDIGKHPFDKDISGLGHH